MTLTIAVILQWIAAIVGIIAAVSLILGAFATLDSTFRDTISNALTSEGITEISAGQITAGVFVAGLVVAGIAVIRVIVAVSLARGHNWARILISVFSVLTLLGGIGSLLAGEWIALVTIVIELIILWLLWNSSSSAFIKLRTAERALVK